MNNVKSKINSNYIDKYKKRKRKYKICFVLSIFTILIIAYFFMLPGITLEGDTHIYWVKLDSVSEINTTDTYIITNENNNAILYVNTTNVNFDASSITLTQNGTTNDNKPYYDVTGISLSDAYYWKYSTSNGNELICTINSTNYYMSMSTYYTEYISTSSRTSTQNITISDTTNNHIRISRTSTNSGTYYLSYSNNTFEVAKDDTTNSNINIYKQITITESSDPGGADDPSEPDVPSESNTYYVKLQSVNELTTDDIYIITDENNNNSISYETGNISFVSKSINVTAKGLTDDNRTYYEITGDGTTEYSQWKIGTNTTINTLYTLADPTMLMRVSTYNATTNFSSTDTTSTVNITVEDAENNNWYITRVSTQTGTGTYYINYSNGSFVVEVGIQSGSKLNIYKQITIEDDDPDNPPGGDSGEQEDIPEVTPSNTSYWERVTNVNEINTNEEYLIVYNDANIFGYSNGTKAGTVTVTQKGINNSGKNYYEITGNTENAYKWKFTSAGAETQLNNVGSPNYYLTLSGSTITGTTATTNTFTYQSASESWKISYVSTRSGNTYYLTYNNSTFQRNSTLSDSNNIYIYHLVNVLVDVNVTTTWNGAEPTDNTIVSLYVKNNLTNTVSKLLDENGNQYSLILTSANNWTGKIENIPYPNNNNTYYLLENKVDGYITSYSNEENNTIGSNSLKTARLIYTNNISNINITNTAGAILPSTGGPGTNLIYSTAIFLLGIVIILEIKKLKYVSNK